MADSPFSLFSPERLLNAKAAIPNLPPVAPREWYDDFGRKPRVRETEILIQIGPEDSKACDFAHSYSSDPHSLGIRPEGVTR